MDESLQMWTEVVFTLSYLAVVWTLTISMMRRLPQVAPEDHAVGRLFMWAFALLALGDTGHVGFRVVAYALDGLGTSLVLFGHPTTLVGLGALSTSITVTGFYIFLLMAWKQRFGREYGWFEAFLFVAAGVRLAMVVLPQNDWGDAVAPWPWSLYRNIPLAVLGLGTAALILRDGIERRDRAFIWIGAMVLLSFTFYVPVILFVRYVPVVGMSMIPKTLAYLAIAVIGYRELF
ncbi:MAG: hypothetical protein JXD18_14860 [Anaerolineae bacterium]|nr:hypothetical protein [Anaerolineae bacterium]